MNCKICLHKVEGQAHIDYHDQCLRALFGFVLVKPVIPHTRKEFMQQAPKKSKGFSISGMQPKLQARITDRKIEIVGQGGDYIVKPCPEEYDYVPENEHVSMLIHRRFELIPPLCGLILFEDGTLAYIVKRYDRDKGRASLHHEDLISMLGLSSGKSNNKYDGAACDKVLNLIYSASKGRTDQLEYMKRLLMSYLIGNGDYHLKNISMVYDQINEQTGRYKMSPVYDVLNTCIYRQDLFPMCLAFYEHNSQEPAVFSHMGNGNYGYQDFVNLAASVGLKTMALHDFYQQLVEGRAEIEALINASYLPGKGKRNFLDTLELRYKMLDRTAP